jgi:hypothetical protein
MFPEPVPQLLIPLTEERFREVVAEEARSAAQEAAVEAARIALLGEFLNAKEAERESGLSARQLRRAREKRLLPYHLVGRAVLYKTSDLLAYCRAGHVPARRSSDGAAVPVPHTAT